MSRKLKVLLISPYWAELKLDEPENMLLARSMFYLGYSLIHTKKLCKTPLDHESRDEYIIMAKTMGMTDDDVIIKT